jgi:hypothetical protein
MGYPRTTLNGIQPAAADVDAFVTLANGVMKNGAYTLEATKTMPEAGTARLLTITHATVAAGTDTLGTVTVVYRNLAGQTLSKAYTPIADQTTTYADWVKEIVSATGAGHTTVGGADTITIGFAADAIIDEGSGTIHGLQINTTANGAITVSDATGNIAVLPANVAVGTFYLWDADWSGWLRVVMAAASNITVLHTGSLPTSYSM